MCLRAHTHARLNELPAYLVISGVVVVSVALRALPQGSQDEASEVGGPGSNQGHWMEERASVSDKEETRVNILRQV